MAKHECKDCISYRLGINWIEKLKIVFWRVIGCNHDTPACLDLGDEDHEYWYCFRCRTKLN
jgi:hypothetical protein